MIDIEERLQYLLQFIKSTEFTYRRQFFGNLVAKAINPVRDNQLGMIEWCTLLFHPWIRKGLQESNQRPLLNIVAAQSYDR